MSNLAADFDAVQNAITASMDQVLRKTRKYDSLSEKYRAKKRELASVEGSRRTPQA